MAQPLTKVPRMLMEAGPLAAARQESSRAGSIRLWSRRGATAGIGMHFRTFQLAGRRHRRTVRALEPACLETRTPPSRFRVLSLGASIQIRAA
jgi:hypothetical protein